MTTNAPEFEALLLDQTYFSLGVWAAERQHHRKSRFKGSLTPWQHRENRSCAILRGRFSATQF